MQITATATASYTSLISFQDAWLNAYKEAFDLALINAQTQASLVEITIQEAAIIIPLGNQGATGAVGEQGINGLPGAQGNNLFLNSAFLYPQLQPLTSLTNQLPGTLPNWNLFTSYNITNIIPSGTSGGYIYISSDYGDTWTSISVSLSGQYQSATANNPENIYISSNYGKTWVPQAWISISISASGQYITAVVSNGYIYTCKNSVASFVNTLGTLQTISPGSTVLGPGYITTGAYSINGINAVYTTTPTQNPVWIPANLSVTAGAAGFTFYKAT